jgi:hypothetical protein
MVFNGNISYNKKHTNNGYGVIFWDKSQKKYNANAL